MRRPNRIAKKGLETLLGLTLALLSATCNKTDEFPSSANLVGGKYFPNENLLLSVELSLMPTNIRLVSHSREGVRRYKECPLLAPESLIKPSLIKLRRVRDHVYLPLQYGLGVGEDQGIYFEVWRYDLSSTAKAPKLIYREKTMAIDMLHLEIATKSHLMVSDIAGMSYLINANNLNQDKEDLVDIGMITSDVEEARKKFSGIVPDRREAEDLGRAFSEYLETIRMRSLCSQMGLLDINKKNVFVASEDGTAYLLDSQGKINKIHLGDANEQ